MWTKTRVSVVLAALLVAGLVGCQAGNRIDNPAATPTSGDDGRLPTINGLTPPRHEPPDSIKVRAEQMLRGRGYARTENTYIAGVYVGNIINQAYSWIGVRYAYGGNSRSGVDCSHLVYQVYRGAGIGSYPFLTTAQMQSYGRFICVNPDYGDIILFRSLGHTGIYVGGGWMIDANSYYGRVMYDYISDPYWRQFAPYAVRYMP